jgi:transforming growth factor-beta-induced protein
MIVKKVLLFIVLLLVSMTALAPAAAQDTIPSIADIVVSSTQSEAPQFTTLLAAIQAADPAVLETLSNPLLDPQVTVFAPTDEAFAALSASIGEEAFNAILADPDQLTGILLYHVIEGASRATDVSLALETFGGRISGPTLNGQFIDIVAQADGGVTIDDANLVTTDITASNGVIHVIDSVLLPETRTIAEIVVEAAGDAEAPEFVGLLAAVQAADPAVLQTLSDPGAQLTVFAPTDVAFAALGEETLVSVLADQATLTNILLYHVLTNRVYSYNLLTDQTMMEPAMGDAGLLVNTALEGQQLSVRIGMDEAFSVTVNGANTLIRDMDAVNGVIHVVDTVLLPSG